MNTIKPLTVRNAHGYAMLEPNPVHVNRTYTKEGLGFRPEKDKPDLLVEIEFDPMAWADYCDEHGTRFFAEIWEWSRFFEPDSEYGTTGEWTTEYCTGHIRNSQGDLVPKKLMDELTVSETDALYAEIIERIGDGSDADAAMSGGMRYGVPILEL